MAGGLIPAAAVAAAIVARVARTLRCDGSPASAMVAAGVAGSIPWSISSADTAGSVATPIMITSVVLARASADQSRVLPGWSGGRCAETMVTPWVRLRWVSGMPASAGAAIAELTPGMTVTGTPASAQASSSSPPRPKMKLSPPFSRTTRRPASPCSTSSSLIRSCGVNSPARDLGHVDHLDARGRLREHGQRRQPVADDHVRAPDRRQTGHGEQPGVAGTAADQGDVADAGRASRRPGRSRAGPDTAGRRPAGGAGDAVVLGVGPVAAGTTRAAPGEVALRPAASVPGDQRPLGEIPHGGGHGDGVHGDHGTGGEQVGDHPEGGRRSAADDDPAAARRRDRRRVSRPPPGWPAGS